MAGRPSKEYHEYLTERANSSALIDHADYFESPATAFLKYTVEAKDAINMCIRNFPKNSGGLYSKASIDSLQHLIVAVLPTIMGHFETYQRYLFAGMFDYSVHLKGFDLESFISRIQRINNDAQIDTVRLAAYRGIGVSSIGILLADSLPSWQNPYKVNGYFEAFNFGKSLFADTYCSQISVLLQLRHSIVHTGGTITRADAQKVEALNLFGDKPITFDNNFIFEASRKMHKLVKTSTESMGTSYGARLIETTPVEANIKIDKLFEVRSSIGAWLNQ